MGWYSAGQDDAVDSVWIVVHAEAILSLQKITPKLNGRYSTFVNAVALMVFVVACGNF